MSHLLRTGQHLEAERRAEVYLRRDPDCRALRALKVEAMAGSGRLKEATAYYRQVARDAPQAELLRAMARGALARGTRASEGELRQAAAQLIRSLPAPRLNLELRRLLGDPLAQVRAAAAVALAEEQQGISTLRELLTGADPRVRALSAQELGRRGLLSLEALRRLAADPFPAVRAAAAQALSSLEGPRAPLLEQLASDDRAAVRWAAVRAIGRLERAAPRQVLVGALDDPHLGVRLAAFQGLAPWPAADLLSLLSGDDPFLALQAGRALTRVDQGRHTLRALAHALDDPRWTVRAAAVSLAGARQVRRIKAVKELVRRGLGDPHPQVQLLAAWATMAAGDLGGGIATARRLHIRACRPGRASVESLCHHVAELLAQKGDQLGLSTLSRLARRGTSTAARITAMSALLRLRADSSLALAALLQQDPLLALHGAAWLHRLAGRPGLF